jgi:hypothetical protein
VFEIAKQAELDSAAKRGRKRARTIAVNVELSSSEDKVLKAECSDSKSDYIIVAGSRTF